MGKPLFYLDYDYELLIMDSVKIYNFIKLYIFLLFFYYFCIIFGTSYTKG